MEEKLSVRTEDLGEEEDEAPVREEPPEERSMAEDHAAEEQAVASSSLRMMIVAMTILVGMLVLVEASLWWEWYTMAISSMDTPSEQTLDTYTLRVHRLCTKIIKWARYSVTMIVDAGYVKELPGLAEAVTTSCGAYACTGWTSNVTQNSSYLCTASAYMVTLLEAMPTVPFVGIGFEDGTMVGASRFSNQTVYAKIRDAQDLLGQGTDYRSYGVSSSTGCYDLAQHFATSTYDPRSRSWYTTTKSAAKSGWGAGVYTDFSTQTLVISATNPLYGLDPATGLVGSTLIGVAIGDCRLHEISTQLAELQPGGSGETYVTEADADGYLIGISTGKVVNETGARIQPSLTNSSLVRSSYDYLTHNYGDTSTTLDSSVVEYTGDVLKGEDLVAMVSYTDVTNTLSWRAIVTIPINEYYQFVINSMIVTGTMVAVAVILIARMVIVPMRLARQAGKLTIKATAKLRLTTMRNIVGCIGIFTVLWMVWLVYTKIETDRAVTDSLDNSQQALAQEITWRWEDNAMLNSVSILEYVTGTLPFGNSNPAEGSDGATLDKHFYNQLNMTRTMAGMAVGFETGDLVRMKFYCRYTDTCEDSDWQVAEIRSSGTSNSLQTFNLTADSSGTSRVRDVGAVVADAGIYSSSESSWYKSAKEAGMATTRTGNPVVSAVYISGDALLVSIAQAFYDGSQNVIGVVAAEVDFEYISEFLLQQLPSSDSGSAMVQQLGEMVAASDKVVLLESSDGGHLRLNVTNSPMIQIRRLGAAIYEEFREFVSSQNSTNTAGNFIKATAPCGSYFTHYTFLADHLSNWTYIQAYARSVYFTNLDTGTERNFVIMAFAFAIIAYVSVKMLESISNRLARKQRKLLFETSDWFASVSKRRGSIMRQDGFDDDENWFHEDGNWFQRKPENSTEKNSESQLVGGLKGGLSPDERAHSAVISEQMALELSQPHLRVSGYRVLESRRYHDVVTEDQVSAFLEELKVRADSTTPLAALDRTMTCPTARLLLMRMIEGWIQSLIQGWERSGLVTDDDALEAKLMELAVECIKGGSGQNFSHHISQEIRVRAAFGDSSWQCRAYHMLIHWLTQAALKTCMIVFILAAFITSRQTKSWVAITCLTPYTLETIAFCYLQDRLEPDFIWVIAMNVILWASTLFPLIDEDDGDSLIAVMLEDFFRPWMLLNKQPQLRDSGKLLGRCMFDARPIFFYMFTVIAIAAIMTNLIFYDKFDPDLGQTVDTFLDSFIYTFIFMSSGENWDVFVYQGYRVDKWSAALWIFLSAFGIFALIAMVIATFETTYAKNRHETDLCRIADQIVRRNVAFLALTWNLPLNTCPVDLQEEEMMMPWYKELPNCVLRVFLLQFMGSDEFSVDEKVNPLLIFPGHTRGKQYANSAHLDHANRVIASVTQMIVLQDIDDNGSITLQEFDQAIIAASCTKQLRGDVLLSSEAMVHRASELVKRTTVLLDACPVWEREMKIRLKANLDLQTIRLRRIKRLHYDTDRIVRELVGITPKFSLTQLDEIMVTVMLFHAFWLSLWGTANQDTIKTIAAVCAGVYVLEVGIRIWCVKGLKGFLHDRRGAHVRFQNLSMLTLAVIGTTAQTLSYMLPAKYDPLCQGLASLQLWRILAVAKNFRQISHAFFLGLKPVRQFIALLLLVMFTYSVFAHYFFHDLSNSDGTYSFRTLEDSCLVMHQVFVGEGWHGIMQDAIDHTNKALIWFFVSYVLVVGVLFSNLFVGILIHMYQYGTEKSSQLAGRVELEMNKHTRDISDEQTERLLMDLGHIAEVIHFPANVVYQGLYDKFERSIHGRGGDIHEWAASLIVQGFRRIVRNRRDKKRKRLEAKLPRGTSAAAIRNAVVQACKQSSCVVCVVESDQSLRAVIRTTCQILSLSDELTDGILAELHSRRAGYLRLYDQRKLHPELKRSYAGLADPAAVSLDLPGLKWLFHELLLAAQPKPSSPRKTNADAHPNSTSGSGLVVTRGRNRTRSSSLESQFSHPCPWLLECKSTVRGSDLAEHIHTCHDKGIKPVDHWDAGGSVAESSMLLCRKSGEPDFAKARWDWVFEFDGQLFCISTRRDDNFTLYLVPYLLGPSTDTNQYKVDLFTLDGVDGFQASSTQRPLHSNRAHYDLAATTHYDRAALVIPNSHSRLADPCRINFGFKVSINWEAASASVFRPPTDLAGSSPPQTERSTNRNQPEPAPSSEIANPEIVSDVETPARVPRAVPVRLPSIMSPTLTP